MKYFTFPFLLENGMNIEALKKKLKPENHDFEIEGFTIKIHVPKSGDVEKCTDYFSTVVFCTEDENGQPIFSLEPSEKYIDIHEVSYDYVLKIWNAIMELTSKTNMVEEIEKK